MNSFFEGQIVICISEQFPVHTTTETDKSIIGKQAKIHPKKGEVLVVNEILGDFLRFDIYDKETLNWWHSSNFYPQNDLSQKINECKILSACSN